MKAFARRSSREKVWPKHSQRYGICTLNETYAQLQSDDAFVGKDFNA